MKVLSVNRYQHSNNIKTGKSDRRQIVWAESRDPERNLCGNPGWAGGRWEIPVVRALWWHAEGRRKAKWKSSPAGYLRGFADSADVAPIIVELEQIVSTVSCCHKIHL